MTTDQGSVAPRRRVWPFVVTGFTIAVIAVVAIGAAGLYSYGLDPPHFESLAAQPDRTLHGTVAFFRDGCVRIIAASGASERKVLCLREDEGDGPQLAWRDDGRLEITTFDWPVGGELRPRAQMLVDVRTARVEQVPTASLPARPAPTAVPAIGPQGESVTTHRDVSGWPVQRAHLTVTLTRNGTARTLMSGSGNPDYGVALGGAPVWSPDGGWIVMSDGRLLLITTGETPRTRVLVEAPSGIGSFGSAGIRTFAATGADMSSTGP